MSHPPVDSGPTTSAAARRHPVGRSRQSLGRIWAMTLKETIQLVRDRVTLATMIAVPLMQLILFGFAINTTPHHMPAAVLMQESSDVGRSILAALDTTGYFDFTLVTGSDDAFEQALQSGKVLFGIEIPAGFERALRRGESPALLVAADATDPVATGTAMGALNQVIETALRRDRFIPDSAAPAFRIVQQRRYNPAGSSQLNIVPGLLGTILTMTLLIFTALSVTREIERGTMENLLSLPIRPVEIMLGKIAPYVAAGFGQAALILTAGLVVFGVPVVGSPWLLAGLTTLFIVTNLSLGYTFSTLAQNQLQAVQMAMMFFLPSILLSGFMFPFSGMPAWAQWIGEILPLTHFLRIVRAIMLKGAGFPDVAREALALTAIMLATMTVAVKRFRVTLE